MDDFPSLDLHRQFCAISSVYGSLVYSTQVCKSEVGKELGGKRNRVDIAENCCFPKYNWNTPGEQFIPYRTFLQNGSLVNLVDFPGAISFEIANLPHLERSITKSGTKHIEIMSLAVSNHALSEQKGPFVGTKHPRPAYGIDACDGLPRRVKSRRLDNCNQAPLDFREALELGLYQQIRSHADHIFRSKPALWKSPESYAAVLTADPLLPPGNNPDLLRSPSNAPPSQPASQGQCGSLSSGLKGSTPASDSNFAALWHRVSHFSIGDSETHAHARLDTRHAHRRQATAAAAAGIQPAAASRGGDDARIGLPAASPAAACTCAGSTRISVANLTG